MTSRIGGAVVVGEITCKTFVLSALALVCSNALAFGQTASLSPKSPNAQLTAYSVGPFALGGIFRADAVENNEYKCAPSNQFAGLTWCERGWSKNGANGSSKWRLSLLHRSDGSIAYINQGIEPASLNASVVQTELNRLAKKRGQDPRVLRSDHKDGLADGVIAVWGDLELRPVQGEVTRVLAAGGNVKEGILVDFLGNFRRSVQHGLPIYRLVGNRGYVWSASFDAQAQGHLRFFAIERPAVPLVPSKQDVVTQPKSEPPPQPKPEVAAQPTPQALPQPKADGPSQGKPQPLKPVVLLDTSLCNRSGAESESKEEKINPLAGRVSKLARAK